MVFGVWCRMSLMRIPLNKVPKTNASNKLKLRPDGRRKMPFFEELNSENFSKKFIKGINYISKKYLLSEKIINENLDRDFKKIGIRKIFLEPRIEMDLETYEHFFEIFRKLGSRSFLDPTYFSLKRLALFHKGILHATTFSRNNTMRGTG